MNAGGPSLWQLQERAKWMRANPTEAERQLWTMLRDRRLGAFKFKRQQIIYPYIVDFVCLAERLIIEADGSQHADNKYDERRDLFLREQPFRMLRIWNSDILSNAAGVFDAVLYSLTSPHPPTASRRAPPSPARGEGFSSGALPNA